MAQGVAIGLVALLFVLLAWSLLHDEGGDLAKQANRGDRPAAPDFTLERLDRDGELQLSSLRGKVVVLNVWASWCGPCKEEAPFLEQVWQRTAIAEWSWSAWTPRTSAQTHDGSPAATGSRSRSSTTGRAMRSTATA